jgi:hypothetical protein
LPASCDNELRLWTALEWNAIKEMIPGALMSDFAAKLMLDKLTEVAAEIGRDRFHETVMKVIEMCDRRPTVARFRMLAGLNSRLDVQQEATAKAWELLSHIVARHLGQDAHGNYGLKTWLEKAEGGYFIEHSVPEISVATRRAAAAMGGWAALAESYPTYWNQKYQMFKDLYRPAAEDMLAYLTHETRLSAGSVEG